VIAGGLRPDHATIARFRARHEQALGGLFSQVLRLLAAEGMVALGMVSLDGTKLAGNAAQKANRTLPQTRKIFAEAAGRDAADDARQGDSPPAATPRALARRGPDGPGGWLPPGTGWRPRTPRAATRSGPGRKPLTRPRRPGNGAGTVPTPSRHARTTTTPSRGRIPPTRTCG
jgi:hypothetical protein